VTGFVARFNDEPGNGLYVSGDTVWFEGVEQVIKRYPLRAALLFMGAARVPVLPNAHVTLTAKEGVEVARALPHATIVPLHYEGWAHFSESREDIDRVFAAAGLQNRLQWLAPGRPTELRPAVRTV
jgi:L-ascorbate metabolism protein UlaG (beta-lactamase superfamily)